VESGFDYVIVGAGTAGCVLAARLSEDRDRSVCLIEAGGSGEHFSVRIPGTVGIALSRDEINWRFQSVPQRELNDRRIPVPRGRGLGGSGLINGMVYVRGHASDYDDWARAGAWGWSFREVLPYFVRSEHNENLPASDFHGRDGPMNLRTAVRPNELNFAFLAALQSLGVPARNDFNAGDTAGVGIRQLQIRDGRRESTATAFLQPAMRRTNLTVLTQALATRIVFEGRRAAGVEVRMPDGTRVVRAQREVVLSAGAIQSPQLLMLSGVGDGEHLRSFGIEVIHDLAAVGRNLHDHLASPVHMVTDHPASYGISWRAMPRNLWHVAQYFTVRRGPLANNVFESVAFVKTLPDLARPDVQLVFQPAKKLKPSFPFPIGHGFAISPVALYPQSRGRLTLASPDALTPPLIDANLLAVRTDIEPLVRATRLIRRVFGAAAFAPYRAVEAAPGAVVQSDEQIAAYIRANAYTVHHPVSTCRMGSDAGSVVDPQLRVRGLEGLRVADASVFPSIIGGNTNAGVIMVAEKASDLIRGRAPLTPAELEEPAPASGAQASTSLVNPP
jgi:choline dehydrogenase-like flavoprotein